MASVRSILGAFVASMLIAGISAFTVAVHDTAGIPELPANDTDVRCTTTPRSIDEIIALEEQGEGTPTDASSTVFIAKVPTGSPANTVTIDAITNVVLELTACVRTIEPLRTYALYTDDYLSAIAASNGSLIDPAPSTPASDELVNEDLRVAVVREVTALDNGQISAIVRIEGIEDSHPAPGRTFLMIFAHEEGQWLLDGQYEKVWDGDSGTAPIDVADLVSGSWDEQATPRS